MKPHNTCCICDSHLKEEDIVPPYFDRNEAMGKSGLGDEVRNFKLRECSVCGSYVAVDKRTDSEYLRKIYETLPKEYWSNLSDQTSFIEFLSLMIRNYKSDGDLWDVGCGDGRILDGLKGSWNKSGIEPGSEAVQIAKAKRLNVMLGTASSMNLKDVADVIICIDVMEHLLDPKVEIRSMHRMLRPGGILIIFTGDAGSINARLNMGNWYYLNCIGHVCVFTKRAMKLLLGNSGFKVRKILTHNHDGSLSVIKWIYCSVRNKISKLFRRTNSTVFYFRDHQLVIAQKITE